MLRATEEILLNQLGRIGVDQPPADRQQLMRSGAMREFLELATRDHTVMSPQVRELHEEQHLVELRSPSSAVALQPRRDMQ